MLLAGGCAKPIMMPNSSYGESDGVFEQRTRDGKLVWKEVWKDKKLVSAWEYQTPEQLPQEVIDAVNRGERDWPDPKWIKTVKNGEGCVNDYDKDGKVIGYWFYFQGEPVRGGH